MRIIGFFSSSVVRRLSFDGQYSAGPADQQLQPPDPSCQTDKHGFHKVEFPLFYRNIAASATNPNHLADPVN